MQCLVLVTHPGARVRPDQIIVPLYKGAWSDRTTLLSRWCRTGYMRSCAVKAV